MEWDFYRSLLRSNLKMFEPVMPSSDPAWYFHFRLILIGFQGTYLDLRDGKWVEDAEDCIIQISSLYSLPRIIISMKNVPSWVTSNRRFSQEVPLCLWKPKVHFHIQSSSQYDCVLNQTNSLLYPSSQPLSLRSIWYYPTTHAKFFSNTPFPSDFFGKSAVCKPHFSHALPAHHSNIFD